MFDCDPVYSTCMIKWIRLSGGSDVIQLLLRTKTVPFVLVVFFRGTLPEMWERISIADL